MVRSGLGGLGLFLGTLAAGAVGFLAIHYLTSGTREKNARLIPDSIERRIDNAVEYLDRRFGRHWVDKGIFTIRRALSRSMPGSAALAEVVFQAEQLGQQRHWRGRQKQRYAMQHYH